jgi:hypothetical protein
MVDTRERLTGEEFMALPDDGPRYEPVEREAKASPTGFVHGPLYLFIGAAAR